METNTTSAQVAKQEANLPQIQEPTNPGHLLELAINKDLDVEKLTKLMELQKAWEADRARKAFFEAMTKFQKEVPEIRKAKAVKFNQTEYKYAALSDITRQIQDTCEKCKLSYRWEIQDTMQEIKVTCLITHIDGHTEQTTMTASPDTSGSKNPIQARSSAITYLQRYTLIGALGISTADSDVDGQGIELTLDELHGVYMGLYNDIIQVDKSFYEKGNPDNWKGERSIGLYKAAIGRARKILADLKVKKS